MTPVISRHGKTDYASSAPFAKDSRDTCSSSDINTSLPFSVPKSWLTSKTNKLGLKDDTPIVKHLKANPKQLWNDYEGVDSGNKWQKDAPPMVLLFPDLAEYLLQGDKMPLQALL